jgi:mannose-6-phosphate isomerase-like protein (cupin superfamily)
MKAKLVNESLQEFLLEDKEEENAIEETEFTQEQKDAIEEFVKEYKGDFEDDDLHAFAEELGLNVHEVEEYIYDMARNKPSDEELKKDSTKKGFHSNIEKDTVENDDFRKVLYTGKNLQLVLMILKPEEEIGEETHDTIDQFFRFEEGTGKCIINGNEYDLEPGDVIIIPAGAKHNIINTSDSESLKMYTIYTPPNHKDGVAFETKEEAESSKEKFDGKTTE